MAIDSAEDLIAFMERVDTEIRAEEPVSRADKTINISSLYQRYRWGDGGPIPLPPEAARRLQLADRTRDDRWVHSFNGGRRFLGIYRSNVGYYWLLRFDGALSEHFLDHIGTAHDAEVRFGGKAKGSRR